MHSLFKSQDYASIPALALPNIGLSILEAEERGIQKRQLALPLRPSVTHQRERTPTRKDSRATRRSTSTTVSSRERKGSRTLHNAITRSSNEELFSDTFDVALTYEDADALTWMLSVLEKSTDPWARTLNVQIPELLNSITLSPTPSPGAPAKIRSALQNGFLFGKLVELLDCITLPGLSDQHNPAVAYNNWAKALSALRTNIQISPAHLFVERDLARAGLDFLHIFLPLLKDLKQAYSKHPGPSLPKQAKDTLLIAHDGEVLPPDNVNVVLQDEDRQHTHSEWKLDVPLFTVLQQLRSDLFISYPIERAHCQKEVSQWLEWLSLEPPVFTPDQLVGSSVSSELITNPWCNGFNFHRILNKIYSVLVADNRTLVLPISNPSTCVHCVQNNTFLLQLAEHCGISCAYRIMADDFIKPAQCEDTIWSLLSSIVQRFPLPDTLASKGSGNSVSAALLPYDPLQFSMLEKSLCHWIFTLGFLTDTPYNCGNVPAFPVLIPHMKTGQLFRDLSLTALHLGIFTHIPSKVSYNSLQHRGRHDQCSASESPHTRRYSVEQDLVTGLHLFVAQKDMGKTLLEEVCRAQSAAKFVSELTRFQFTLLLEDIHRCWNKVPPRHLNPEPYTPYAPLSSHMERLDNLLSSISEGSRWEMEASFVRPPDEVLIDTQQLIPNLWFLPEIRGYPMNYSPENEIAPLFTPLLEAVRPQ